MDMDKLFEDTPLPQRWNNVATVYPVQEVNNYQGLPVNIVILKRTERDEQNRPLERYDAHVSGRYANDHLEEITLKVIREFKKIEKVYLSDMLDAA